MFWLGCLIGYFVGAVSTLCLVLFTYKIGEMNKAERHWYEINFMDQSAKKEMEQLKKIKNEGEKA